MIGANNSAFAVMIQQNFAELAYNELAAKLIDGLDKLDHKFEKGAAERWIWELLQNAKDCCSQGQKSVKRSQLMIFKSNSNTQGSHSPLSTFSDLPNKHLRRRGLMIKKILMIMNLKTIKPTWI